MTTRQILYALLLGSGLLAACSPSSSTGGEQRDPIDYVNPYLGSISHLLVPTFPTVHLPT